MVRLQLSLELNYEVFEPGCDFIFNIHAAHTARQRVIEESLVINQNLRTLVETDPATLNRYLRVSAKPGPLRVAYNATVDLAHFFASPESISEIPVAQLPAPVLSYIYPSRYCQSDRLHKFAMREFGQRWQGYGRVQAFATGSCSARPSRRTPRTPTPRRSTPCSNRWVCAETSRI